MTDFRELAKLEAGVTNKGVTFHNGPVILILLGLLLFISAFFAGYLGMTVGGIAVFVIACILFLVFCVISSVFPNLLAQVVDRLIRSASDLLFVPFGMPDQLLAYEFLKNYLLYGELPLLIVTNGEIDRRTADSPIVKLGNRGPGTLIVDVVSAVLVEREGMHRVLRSGTHFLDYMDKIKGFLDLRLQKAEIKLENAFTRDNIPLKLTVIVEYWIKKDQDVLLNHSRHIPDREAVTRAVLLASNWKAQTETTIRGKIRDIIADVNLNDIHGTYPDGVIQEPVPASEHEYATRVPLQKQLQTELNSALVQWGGEIVKVTIDEITMPDAVKETLRLAWAALWDNKIQIQGAETGSKVAEIKRETTLINAQASAEAHRIRATATGEAQLDAVRRAERIGQLIGHPIDEKVLNEMLRDAMVSRTETRTEKERRDGSTNQSVEGQPRNQ